MAISIRWLICLSLGQPSSRIRRPTLLFHADSWHYIPAFSDYIKGVAYIMAPLTAFFLIFLIAKSFGRLLGYLHTGQGSMLNRCKSQHSKGG